jgi:hypothetical protein
MWVLIVVNSSDIEWDDGCPGLVETLAREAEWEEREAHNDVEAACWAIDPPDGWGNTPPASPVPEGWPGVVVDEHNGNWPSLSEVVPLCVDSWPNLSTSVEGGIEVTIEVVTNAGDPQEKHTAVMFPIILTSETLLTNQCSLRYAVCRHLFHQ